MGPEEAGGVQVTGILRAWAAGDDSALERLTPIVYAELHRLAQSRLARERGGHLLQPSALVNEAFVRLISAEPVPWSDRAHFFAYAARLMRRILIDYARAQERDKRGGGAQHLQLTDLHDLAATDWRPIPFLDLDAALNELAELSPRQQQVVELRYFGGLELDEVAEVLGISERTIVRDWNAARAWLLDKLQNSASSPESSGAGH